MIPGSGAHFSQWPAVAILSGMETVKQEYEMRQADRKEQLLRREKREL